jgi:hypothetical protein
MDKLVGPPERWGVSRRSPATGPEWVRFRGSQASAFAAMALVFWSATARAQTAPVPIGTPPPLPPPAADGRPQSSDVPTPVALTDSPARVMTTLFGWKGTFYGFLELDAIRDSTQSFSDSVGNTPLLRSDGSSPAYLPIGTNLLGVTYGSRNPRVFFTPRNTTFGFKVAPPDIGSVKINGIIEFDFFGNQPGSPFAANSAVTESEYFSSATPRMRHAYVELKSDFIDVLAGQAYNLFGWQPLFFPATDSFLGLPNMVFDRRAQLRLTKVIETDPITVRVAGAALRPAQADSGFPDLSGGILVQINPWKGAHMAGPGQAKLDPLSIGVSGVYRQFKVAQFENNAGDPSIAQQVATANGYGISIDALLPIIPVKDAKDRSNGLTVTGSFVTGTGIGDLYTGGLTGGAHFPLPNGPQGPFTGTYSSNIDPGLVQYSIEQQGPATTASPLTTPVTDANGNWVGILRTLDWQSFMIGVQYYLPFLSGRWVITGNYTHAFSDNIQQQNTASFANEKSAGGDPTRTFSAANYYDANLFIGITDSFKAALSWQRVEQHFLAHGLAGQEVMGDSPEHNDRLEISTFFFF